MATTRPWVVPTEVKDYSDFQQVKDRADAKLEKDIRRAENEIIQYLNRDFTELDSEGNPFFTDIPDDVIDATIILAESIAMNSVSSSKVEGLKSESFDDYSYVRGSAEDRINNLGLGSSLNPYIYASGSGSRTVLKMRRL